MQGRSACVLGCVTARGMRRVPVHVAGRWRLVVFGGWRWLRGRVRGAGSAGRVPVGGRGVVSPGSCRGGIEGSGVGGAVRTGSACCPSPRAASASSRDPSVWRRRELGSNPPVTLTSCAAVGSYSAFPCVHLLICKVGTVVPTSGRRALRTRVLLRVKSREQPWKAPHRERFLRARRCARAPRSSRPVVPGLSPAAAHRGCCAVWLWPFGPVLSSVPVAPRM